MLLTLCLFLWLSCSSLSPRVCPISCPLYWGRLLRVPWTTRRSNPLILKEISLEYSLEGLMMMLMLKLQYFGHLIWRADSLEKSLMLGNIEGRRRRWCQRMRWLDGITKAMDVNLGKLQEVWGTRRPACCSPCDVVPKSWRWQQWQPLGKPILTTIL